MKIAFLFAGQGAQTKGMGKDIYDNVAIAKEIYDKYPKLRDLCFLDKNEVINQTKYFMYKNAEPLRNILKR